MRISIEFPYDTHWKTKEKFKKDNNLKYPRDVKGKEVKNSVILNTPDDCWFILNFICSLKNKFPFVEIWDIEIPDTSNAFALFNAINYILIPKRVIEIPSYIDGSIAYSELDHA